MIDPDVDASGAPPEHRIPAHLRYLTMFVCIPLMALATAGFGSVSLICGCGTGRAVSNTLSRAFGQQ